MNKKIKIEKPYVEIIMPKNMCKDCHYLKQIKGEICYIDRMPNDIVQCYLCNITNLEIGDVCPNCLKGKLIDN